MWRRDDGRRGEEARGSEVEGQEAQGDARRWQVISWYLTNHVFPLTMRVQPLKLSASGSVLL